MFLCILILSHIIFKRIQGFHRIWILEVFWDKNQLLKQSIIWKYSTIQNKTYFHNLQNSMKHWKYFYLLDWNKICFHIIVLNRESLDDFKFPSFSIKHFQHCFVQFITILYFEISEHNELFIFLLFHYFNSTVCKKLVLLPNCVNAWKYHWFKSVKCLKIVTCSKMKSITIKNLNLFICSGLVLIALLIWPKPDTQCKVWAKLRVGTFFPCNLYGKQHLRITNFFRAFLQKIHLRHLFV